MDNMRTRPLRLNPGDDLRAALDAALAVEHESAAFVIAGIGSLKEASVRLAGADDPVRIVGDIEILTLAGTLSLDGSHLHISLADATGHVLGGHVSPGCIVRTTVEVLIGFLPGQVFTRPLDAATGYRELSTKNASISASNASGASSAM